MSKLLIDEHPLQVLPSLAKKIGLNEAIILQQIHYWLKKSEHVREGEDGEKRRWIYNTLADWEEQFPFWSKSTISRALNSLKNQGLIVIDHPHQNRGDRTSWFTINYDKLGDSAPMLQNEKPISQDETDPLQNETPVSHDATSTNKDTETTTENNSERGAREENGSEECGALKLYQEYYPDIQLNWYQKDLIRNKVDDVGQWRRALMYWKGNDYLGKNVQNILAKYEELAPDDWDDPMRHVTFVEDIIAEDERRRRERLAKASA